MNDGKAIKKWIVILSDGSETYLYGDNIIIALLNRGSIDTTEIRAMYREDWPRFPVEIPPPDPQEE